MKKIALFSDGTGKSSASPQKTNVWRAYQALDRTPDSDQVAFYDNGVGTTPFTPFAVLGLAFGIGLAANVRQIYGFVCRSWEPGDKIYGFGFSRGAFTMRVVMGLIADQGIIDRNRANDDRDLDRLIRAAYREFRRNNFSPSILSAIAVPVRDAWLSLIGKIFGHTPYDRTRNHCYPPLDGEDPLISFVGVWDTVDAYGLPITEMTRAWDKVVWPLTAKDRDLSPRVARACQALAVDEQRLSFSPMLWNENNAQLGKNIEDERITQLWFAGVHTDVGGGYPDDALALTTLNWMLDESEKNDGLKYLPERRKEFEATTNGHGPLHDSRAGLGNFYRYAPRDLEKLCNEEKPGFRNWVRGRFGMAGAGRNAVEIARPKIHHTVFERIDKSGNAYGPINLPADYAVVDGNGNVHSVAGKKPTALLPETPEIAGKRKVLQAYIWNKVRTRKFLYYLTLAAVALFILFPYYQERLPQWLKVGELGDWAARFFGTLSSLVHAIPELVGKIPGLGFAESWARDFAAYPFVFLFGVVLIAILFYLTAKVDRVLKSDMYRIWRTIMDKGTTPPDEAGPIARWFSRLFASKGYGVVKKWFTRAVETAAVLVFSFLVLAVANQIILVAADGLGGTCNKQAAKPVKFGDIIPFNPKDPCFATGLNLKKGERYLIEFHVEDDWRDEKIPADAVGWLPGEASWYLYLATPLRRHWFVEWYRPIARIGNRLFDLYPLKGEGSVNDALRPKRTVRMEFKARSTGGFYVFLNDAAILWASEKSPFYRNNEGTACLRVTEIKTDAEGSQSAYLTCSPAPAG